MSNLEVQLEKLYTDLSSGDSFTSPKNLYDAARKTGLSVTLATVKKYLSGRESYVRFKQARRKHPRNRMRAETVHQYWGADLAVIPKEISGKNRNFKYILVVVDYLSRQLFARLIRNKFGMSRNPVA